MLSGDTQGTGSPNKVMTLLKEQGQLVVEICHFTQDLNPIWHTKTTIESLNHLSHPFLLSIKEDDDEERVFKKAADYFFNHLKFKRVPVKKLNLNQCFLPTVLKNKQGPTPLLMLLFSSFLEQCGLRVQITSCRKRFLLKLQLDGRSRIVDFTNKCRTLDADDIVELVNSGFNFAEGAMGRDILAVEYFNLLKSQARKENKMQILALVHSYLMKYQPFNLRHLSERARIAYETGDYRTAIEDIRNYFQYKQPEFTNIDLKRIYKIALKKEKSLR